MHSQNMMRIALVQSKCVEQKPSSNVSIIENAVKTTDADLFLFPELFLSGYDIQDSHRKQASFIDNELIERLKKISIRNECDIIVGAPFLEGQTLYNSLLFFKKDGEMERYDKIHLADFGPFTEKKEFVPGNSPLMVESGGFRFGLSICYDLFFPEMFKHYALNGADGLICISASPRSSKIPFETVLPARAVENTCYVMFINNTGTQGNTSFFGGSRVITPIGRTIEEIDEEEGILVFSMDRKEIIRARTGRPTIRDSVPEVWHQR